jgi:hypothetical protein
MVAYCSSSSYGKGPLQGVTVRTSGGWSSHKAGLQLPLVGLFLAAVLFSSALTIRLSGLRQFRINYEIMNLIDSRQDSLDGRAARRKAATYTGQHKYRTNADRPRVGFEHTVPVLERSKTFPASDRAATVIGSHYFISKYLTNRGEEFAVSLACLIVVLNTEQLPRRLGHGATLVLCASCSRAGGTDVDRAL